MVHATVPPWIEIPILIPTETIQWFQHPGLFWDNGRHIQGAVSQVSQGVGGSRFIAHICRIFPPSLYGKRLFPVQGVRHKGC